MTNENLERKFEEQNGLLVPVETLIPGIGPKSEEDYKTHGQGFKDTYADEFATMIDLPFLRTRDELKHVRPESHPIVDLGCGPNPFGYFTALAINQGLYLNKSLIEENPKRNRFKGYVGVDKDESGLGASFQKPKRLLEEFNKTSKRRKQGRSILMPASVVYEDMLSFLKRLPDSSVSIMSSGQVHVMNDHDENSAIEKEMARVLHRDGIAVLYETPFRPSNYKGIKEINDGAPRIYTKQ